MDSSWGQGAHRVRFDWGPLGADAVAGDAAVVAVVDVLSFTTALGVAVERGIAVRPFAWRDESAGRLAREHDAVLAVGRREVTEPGQVSLAPGTIRRSRGIARLVLPSPNGATVCARLAEGSATVVGVSLRNAEAAAQWATREAGGVVAVVAAGERWPDGSLRPAVEDLWGAGAFLDHLVRGGATGLSPEAGAALAAYRSVAGSLSAALSACGSGVELREGGFAEDVAIAAEAGVSETVPILREGWFVADSAL